MRSIAVVVMLLVSSSAFAQATPPPPPKKPPPVKIINIDDPLALRGKLRSMSLLYFLERANDELERSTLPNKTFVPRIVQTVEDERL